MDELLRRLAANGFAELEGLHINGSIPVRQDLVNEIIAAMLQNSGEARTQDAAAATTPGGTPNLLKLVKRAEVRLVEGKMILDVEIRR